MKPDGRIGVIHLLTDRNTGGAGKHLLYLLSASDRERFDYTVVLPDGAETAPEFEKLGVRVITLPGFFKSRAPGCYKALKKLFEEEKPNVVHTHSSLTARRAAKAAGVPLIVMTKHCSDMPPEYTRDLLGRTICRAHFKKTLDHAIATDESAAAALTACGMPEGMITVIENGALPLQDHTEDEKAALREKLDIPEGAIIAGCFSRLEPVKAIHDVLAAAALLKKQAGNLYFIIVGKGSLEEQLKQTAHDYGIEDRVRFCGFAGDISLYMSLCTFNLNTSTGTETTNLALTEGMNLGVIPVVTDTGGNRRLVERGDCGEVIPPDDPPALAAALLKLMRDPEQIVYYRKKALSFYECSRTAERMAEETEQLYLRLLGMA